MATTEQAVVDSIDLDDPAASIFVPPATGKQASKPNCLTKLYWVFTITGRVANS